MKLIDYMRSHNLDPAAMAARLSGIGEHGIRKLMYGERNPSIMVAVEIETVTHGQVGLRDWIEQSVAQSSGEQSGAAA